MQDYFNILKWHTFIWSAKTLLKTSNNVFFLLSHHYFFFKSLECRFVIKEINLIVFIYASVLWKKTKILALI
jgi:hypothetical protein